VGQPIILIPGPASSGEVWDEPVAQLSSNCECHVLTLSGFAGFSPIDLKDVFLPQMKNEIRAYFSNLKQPMIALMEALLQDKMND
jgi:hypothetical protein